MSGPLCPNQLCRARLYFTTNGSGRDVAICELCDRNKRGLCRDCPRALAFKGTNRGSTQRCPSCRKRQATKVKVESYQRHRGRLLREHRWRLKNDPVFRAEKMAAAAAYRETHKEKRDDIARLYHKLWTRAAYKKPEYRNRVNRRRTEIRQAKRRQAVLAGQVKRLTARDRQVLRQAA